MRRTVSAVERSGGVLERTWVALQRTGGALNRAGVALQRTGDPPDRAGGAIERSRHVLPLEPATAHTEGSLIISVGKGALTPNWDDVRTCVRTYARHAGKYCSLHISRLNCNRVLKLGVRM